VWNTAGTDFLSGKEIMEGAMSLILDKINYVYSEGTAYQIQALKDVNWEIRDGQFIGSKRKITKRGSSTLRKIGYEVMRVLKSHPAPKDDAVYNYILKKEGEGKSKKHAKIAGLNKFLRIYYARVIAVYQ